VTPDLPPAVAAQAPPKLMLTVFNPIFARLIRSPLHRFVDESFMLLQLTGRRSGRRYEVVVGRHELDGVLTVMTSAPWRLNTQGGVDVGVTLDGRVRHGRGVLVDDVERVSDAYAGEIARIGWKPAQRTLGLKLAAGRAPTRDELRSAVARDGLSLIEIRDLSD
jgi:hypothetical protein